MAGPFQTFKTDPKKEKEGVRAHFDGWYMDVARAGGANKEYARTMREKFADHLRAIETGTMSGEKADTLMCEVYAQSIVTGWGSDELGHGKVAGPDGETAMDFNAQNVVEALKFNNFEIYRMVRKIAEDFTLYKQGKVEEAAKN